MCLLECPISHEENMMQAYHKIFYPLGTHSLCGMQPPLDDRMNPWRQKHPRTHWYVQNFGGGLPQILGQAVPHSLKTSPLPHFPGDGRAPVCTKIPNIRRTLRRMKQLFFKYLTSITSVKLIYWLQTSPRVVELKSGLMFCPWITF